MSHSLRACLQLLRVGGRERLREVAHVRVGDPVEERLALRRRGGMTGFAPDEQRLAPQRVEAVELGLEMRRAARRSARRSCRPVRRRPGAPSGSASASRGGRRRGRSSPAPPEARLLALHVQVDVALGLARRRLLLWHRPPAMPSTNIWRCWTSVSITSRRLATGISFRSPEPCVSAQIVSPSGRRDGRSARPRRPASVRVLRELDRRRLRLRGRLPRSPCRGSRLRPAGPAAVAVPLLHLAVLLRPNLVLRHGFLDTGLLDTGPLRRLEAVMDALHRRVR